MVIHYFIDREDAVKQMIRSGTIAGLWCIVKQCTVLYEV